MKLMKSKRALTLLLALGAVLAWQVWTSSTAGPHKEARADAAPPLAAHEETRTKLVPIFTVGGGTRVGIAQVAGPVSRVDQVKAVAQLDTDYKDRARIRVLVPISTEHVISNIKRVPQVSITGEAALRL